MAIQTALRLIYPARCLSCDVLVESDFGLCGACWRETPFITGLACDLCGTPLPGEDPGEPVHCDECLRVPRPWKKGRAAFLYRDNGRKLILALKHGDRQDIVRPAAKWLAHAARPLLEGTTLIAPIPLHWTRLLRRRFNQSALLARALAREVGQPDCPDLLQRKHRTPVLEGLGFDGRFSAVADAFRVTPTRVELVKGQRILLVDDVMTSGATLSEAAQALYAAGAREVCVLALARAAKAT